MSPLIRYLFTATGFVFLVLTAIACLRGNKATALACMPAALLVVLGNLDQFASFKVSASSFEAKMTEKLADADRIIAQLRRYAVSTAMSLIEARENSNAIVTSNDFPAADAYKASLIQSLKEIGVAPEVITQVEQSDSNLVLNFYSYAAFRFGSDGFLPDEKKRQEFNSAWNALSDEQRHSPDQVQMLYDRFRVDGTKFSPYMEDFRYYVRAKEQRRPDVWAKRETWGYGRTSPGSVFPNP